MTGKDVLTLLLVNYGFKEIEMVKLLNNIMYLTETVRKRLLPLMD